MNIKERCLRIVEQELEELHVTVQDTKDSHQLVMTAHSISILQNLRARIKKEVHDDTRIYEVLP